MGRDAQMLCWGKLSSISRPGPYMLRILLYPSCLHVHCVGQTPLYCACSHVGTPAQPFNIVTTLFAIFLPCLTYSRPQPCRPLTQLSFTIPETIPLLKCLPSALFLSPLSVCLSSTPFLPSTNHVPWVFAQPLG